MNWEIKLVWWSLWNCWPQFIGDSLYYFERKWNSLVLLKDNEIINLWSDIISNKSMSCFSSVEGNFIFWHNEIPVVEVKISEYGDIALFEKDDKDNWSVYINGDKLNRQFRSWSTFQFWNKWMYWFFAKKDNESMIIREWWKCIL